MSRYDNIKSVKLNTILDISNMKYFSAMNVYTCNKDTKYKSYDGVVYSKVVQPSLTANSSLFSGIPKTVLPSFEYTTPS